PPRIARHAPRPRVCGHSRCPRTIHRVAHLVGIPRPRTARARRGHRARRPAPRLGRQKRVVCRHTRLHCHLHSAVAPALRRPDRRPNTRHHLRRGGRPHVAHRGLHGSSRAVAHLLPHSHHRCRAG